MVVILQVVVLDWAYYPVWAVVELPLRTGLIHHCVYEVHMSLTINKRSMTPFFRDIMPAVRKNREREKSRSAYDPSLFTTRLTPLATHTYVCTNMDICASMCTNSSCPNAAGEAWFWPKCILCDMSCAVGDFTLPLGLFFYGDMIVCEYIHCMNNQQTTSP